MVVRLLRRSQTPELHKSVVARGADHDALGIAKLEEGLPDLLLRDGLVDVLEVDLAARVDGVVHPLELVHVRVLDAHREVGQAHLAALLHLGGQAAGLCLAPLQQDVDVLVRHLVHPRLEHLLRPEADHAQQLVFAGGGVRGLQSALLDDGRVQVQLLQRPLVDALLHRPVRDEAEHGDRLLLPDPVRAVLGLQVHLGVPVAVVQDHGVGGRQVDAQAPGAGGQHEEEHGAVGGVEALHALVPLEGAGAPVEAVVRVALPDQVVLHDVQHPRHLAEQQHAVALGLQPRQQLVQDPHLPGVVDDLLVGDERRPLLCAIKEVWVIAGLPQLHHNVQQLGLTARPLIDDRRVFCQDVRVPLALHLRHPTPHVDLLLGRDAGVHLCLEAPQHERLQQLMHLLNDVGIGRTFACIVPVVELLAVVEEVRQQKVQQRPQLVEVVLQRRACHEHPVVALEPAHCVTQHRVLILEPVGLVHDDVLEAELLQDALLGVGGLVRRDNHVVLARDHVLLPHARPLLFAPVELEHRQVWAPLLHLFAPVHADGQRAHDQVRPGDAAGLLEVPEQRDGLERLAQPHLVRQDPVEAAVEQVDEPVHALNLVVPQLALEVGGRLRQAARPHVVLHLLVGAGVPVRALGPGPGPGDGALGVGLHRLHQQVEAALRGHRALLDLGLLHAHSPQLLELLLPHSVKPGLILPFGRHVVGVVERLGWRGPRPLRGWGGNGQILPLSFGRALLETEGHTKLGSRLLTSGSLRPGCPRHGGKENKSTEKK
mmetsp:Transcript_47611/g.79829  ORF Transcript_47611/g.79829 Transcript_47611/m.79829 type:complete len:768 (+) Transcript_47611:2909-5212(+)